MTNPPLAPAVGPVHSELIRRTLRERLASALPERLRRTLDTQLRTVAERGPGPLDEHFLAAELRYGRAPLPGWAGWSVPDAVRTRLLAALPLTGTALAEEAERSYARGAPGERKSVLLALPFLPVGDAAVGIVEDAVRSGDPRLLAVALGPYAGRHLDQDSWRRAVLACLSAGVALTRVDRLADRRDPGLARLAQDFAAGRRAARGPVPDDLWLIAGALP
ncbi:EboA domain-containing protein [Streptomyces sp. VRA16 Mangrove soil]|uniref:EboA domain-containing protein n=1 Tax=Streptomyces sp. VRA16 Mangrove soil TaxID=2817434 RepID=UPI001A9F9E75|nr:EboA domain-containing protein [Streptomyces sp. VRA16 Mangrove soil]MBO1334068.1 EboA domain-containing protein [Streptomyces sp. VRA16 Mangrove soil]